jgi:hypothetical protein
MMPGRADGAERRAVLTAADARLAGRAAGLAGGRLDGRERAGSDAGGAAVSPARLRRTL